MSFRELRNFTEIMRALGYPRLISVENFRMPNFELVADCLYWMVKRYDPSMNISDDIDDENMRVDFINSVLKSMLVKARLKLNGKKLYAADGRAVRELLKLARVLYDAHRFDASKQESEAEPQDATPVTKVKDLKGARALATELTERGAKLYDLLGHEVALREERLKAMTFLDAISSNLSSTSEHQYIEKRINQIMAQVKENVENLEKQCQEMKADEKNLDAKIKKKSQELDRNEKRLKSLQSVRPAFMDEYEKLEEELVRHYEVYLERFRNLDYLEDELERMNQVEREKLKDSDRQLQRMQKRLRDEELRILRGEGEIDGDAQFEDTPGMRNGHGDRGVDSRERAGRGGGSESRGGRDRDHDDRVPMNRPGSAGGSKDRNRDKFDRGVSGSKVIGSMTNDSDNDLSSSDGDLSQSDVSGSPSESEEVSMGSGGSDDSGDLSGSNEEEDSDLSESADGSDFQSGESDGSDF